MKHLQSYLHEYTASFEVFKANEPFKDENTPVAIRGLGEWAMSLNSGAVAVDPATEIPVNAMTESIAEGFLLARYEVE